MAHLDWADDITLLQENIADMESLGDKVCEATTECGTGINDKTEYCQCLLQRCAIHTQRRLTRLHAFESVTYGDVIRGQARARAPRDCPKQGA